DRSPQQTDPDAWEAVTSGDDGGDVRIEDDVDLGDPSAVGPPDLCVGSRIPSAPEDPATRLAPLATAQASFTPCTAMRPHAGVGQSQPHVTLSTGVLSHTLTFHEPFSAREWLLLAHHSVHAGHGRCYGRADVFRGDGALVASFVQDGMIRRID